MPAVEMNLNLKGNASGLKQAVDEAQSSFVDLVNSTKDFSDPNVLNGLMDKLKEIVTLNAEVQKSMPGYNGLSQLNNTIPPSQRLDRFSSSMETAQEIARLKATIENLNRNIEKANDEISKSNEKGDALGTRNWTSSLNQMEEAKQRAQNQLEKLEAGEKDKGIDALVKDRLAQMYSQGWNYAIQGASIHSGYRQAIAGGDYLGAGVTARDQIGGVAMGLGGTLMSAGGMMMASGVGFIPGVVTSILGALSMGGGGILKLISADQEAALAEAEAYERSLPSLHSFNRRYSRATSVNESMKEADALHSRAIELTKGTGMTTYDFLQAALQQTAYGATKEEALSRTRMAALWGQATGADVGTIQDVLGITARLGNATTTEYLAKARNAAGLDKGQTNEFLQSLLGVVEDGISRGYSKSSEEAAHNFAMFAGLSNNNPLWLGKYAAQKINTMSGTISSATNLSDINQIMTVNTAYDVARGMNSDAFSKAMGFGKTGTYLDAMLIAERGLTPELFRGIGQTINDLEGDNLVARVERWKSMSGLNYKGAIELDNMYRSGTMTDAQIADKIENMKSDPALVTEETKKMDYLNKIEGHVRNIGQSKFWDNFDILASVENEQRLKAMGYVGRTSPDQKPTEYRDLMALLETQSRFDKFDGYQEYRNMVDYDYNDLDSWLKQRIETWVVDREGYIGLKDILSLFSEMSKDTKLKEAYDRGNERDYIAAFEEMFTRLLSKGITLYKEN